MKRSRLNLLEHALPKTWEAVSQHERLIYFGLISARLQQTTVSAQQFVYFSGLIAAGIVSAGLVGNQPLIVILAPYALTFALTYQLQLYTDVECLTVLKEHIEASLNREFPLKMYLEGAALSAKYRNRMSIRILQFIYIGLIVIVFVQSIRTSYKHQTRWSSAYLDDIGVKSLNLHVVNVIGIITCTALLAIASSELVRAGRATEKRITAAENEQLT